jgi:hypothetical protein
MNQALATLARGSFDPEAVRALSTWLSTLASPPEPNKSLGPRVVSSDS